jgi:hypothetical protein
MLGASKQGQELTRIIMTLRSPARRAGPDHIRTRRDLPQPVPRPSTEKPVPKVVRDATDRFLKKYERTLRDLEKF